MIHIYVPSFSVDMLIKRIAQNSRFYKIDMENLAVTG